MTSAFAVGGQTETAFSSPTCQSRINPSCFTDMETEAQGRQVNLHEEVTH